MPTHEKLSPGAIRPLLWQSLLIALPLLVLANLIIWMGYQLTAEGASERWRRLSELSANSTLIALEKRRKELVGDLKLLASNPALAIAIQQGDEQIMGRVAADWALFAAEKQLYDQIRLLDTAGRELLRVDLTSHGASRVPSLALQNKSRRYYFQDLMQLDPGQTYASPIDLNIEHGKLELPYKPMLRLASPLPDSRGETIGFLILNVLARHLLDDLATHAELTENHLLLLDDSGYFLRGFNTDQEWGFMLEDGSGNNMRFDLTYPEVWSVMQGKEAGQIDHRQGLFSFRTVHYGSTQHKHHYRLVVAMLDAEQNRLLASQQRLWMRISLLISILLLIVAMLTAHQRLRIRKSVQALKREEEQLRLILTSTGDGVLGLDVRGRVSFINPSALRMLGYTHEAVIGADFSRLVHSIPADAEGSGDREQAGHDDPLRSLEAHSGQDLYWRKEGEPFPVEYQVIPIAHPRDQLGVVVSFKDITFRLQTEARIQYLVQYNDLTSLPNRLLLLDRLQQQLALARQNGTFGALLHIDLDRFKQINETLGHDLGDSILAETARRLEACCERTDILAHIGRDEFVLLTEAQQTDAQEMARLAQYRAEEIGKVLAEPFIRDTLVARLTASIGVVILPLGGKSAGEALRYSDAAVTNAKTQGRNSISFYSPEMEEASRDWLTIHSRLPEAMTKERLRLLYQPQVDPESRVFALEALLRWNDPELGEVSPTRLIAVAEETGQMPRLGRFILRKAFEQMHAWDEMGLLSEIDYVSVNISAMQFAQADLVDDLERLLREYDMPGHYLELDLVESSLIASVSETQRKLQAIKSLGVRLAIDDFGTGYSSLLFLQELPIDRLKVDRAFVSEIDLRTGRRTIMGGIILLAQQMGLTLMAEGVEREAEFNLLLSMGCRSFQGNLFHRPLTGTAVCQLLQHQQTRQKTVATGVTSESLIS
ncbi:MAG: EAL domain-containing protein [Candidatus Thiodiazotropha sp. (ex Dulcina madagascariensis)]|nr:EAL domain-containing protein [Candidatus Thiodiazotropha sp. (ex Dulcina madagascariensis)]